MKHVIKDICYLGISALTLYLAVIYNSKGLLFLCAVTVLLPPLLFLLLLPEKRKIEYRLAFPETVQSSSDMEKTGIEVKNNGNMELRIKGKLLFLNKGNGKTYRRRIQGTAAAGEKVLISVKWKSADLGAWQISCKGLWIYESFGWVCIRKREKRTGTVMVLPECFETGIKVGIRTRLFFSDGEQYHPQWNGDDPAEILKLREYREGDRMNRIHWKLSARNDMLIVKELSMPLGCNVVFFLNTDKKGSERKSYWEIVHSISAEMLQQQCFHYLAWFDKKEGKILRKAVRKEEDLYEFWVELPERELEQTNLKNQYSRQFLGEQYVSYLELNDKMELFCNGRNVQRFTEEKVQEQLQGMELIL